MFILFTCFIGVIIGLAVISILIYTDLRDEQDTVFQQRIALRELRNDVRRLNEQLLRIQDSSGRIRVTGIGPELIQRERADDIRAQFYDQDATPQT